jgi:uncharacterized protein (TIGR00251 family)
VTIAVWATPGASRSEVVGVADGCVRVRLAAPAREGKANRELVRLIADALDVGRRDVTLVAGGSGRRKLVRVRGIDLAGAHEKLGF